MSQQQQTITNLQSAAVSGWASAFALSTTTAATILTGNVDGLAHLITIVPSASMNSTVFTLTGTDADGHSGQTDTITLSGAAAAVTSTQFFKTLTAVTIATSKADSVTADVGFADDCVGKTLFLDWRSTAGATVAVDTNSANVTFAIQEYIGGNAYLDSNPARVSGTWKTSIDTKIDSETADAVGVLTAGITACRLIGLAASDATTDLTVTVTQPSVR